MLFRSARAWIILVLCWILCLLCACVTSVLQEPSIWRICPTHAPPGGLKDNFALPLLKFIFLFGIPLLLIELIYTRIYLAAKANCEKLRSKTSFIDSNLSNSSSVSNFKDEISTEDQIFPSRSGSFTQKFARSELVRSASNASSQLISSIRKRVLATNHFIRVMHIFL